ncbi:MAG: NUDIX domain-containing protein, partial [Algoriella sp.]
AHLDNNLTEHELDHVFIGTFDEEPQLNPDEVMAYRWVDLMDLKKDIEKNPQNYTAWFKIIFENYVSYIEA